MSDEIESVSSVSSVESSVSNTNNGPTDTVSFLSLLSSLGHSRLPTGILADMLTSCRPSSSLSEGKGELGRQGTS